MAAAGPWTASVGTVRKNVWYWRSGALTAFAPRVRDVAVVPGEAFGSPGYLRMSYALGDDDLEEGVSRMQKLFA